MAAPVKSCSLDPIPTFLLRECIDVILPFLTAMVNASLQDGNLPAAAEGGGCNTSVKEGLLDPQDLKVKLHTGVQPVFRFKVGREISRQAAH